MSSKAKSISWDSPNIQVNILQATCEGCNAEYSSVVFCSSWGSIDPLMLLSSILFSIASMDAPPVPRWAPACSGYSRRAPRKACATCSTESKNSRLSGIAQFAGFFRLASVNTANLSRLKPHLWTDRVCPLTLRKTVSSWCPNTDYAYKSSLWPTTTIWGHRLRIDTFIVR